MRDGRGNQLGLEWCRADVLIRNLVLFLGNQRAQRASAAAGVSRSQDIDLHLQSCTLITQLLGFRWWKGRRWSTDETCRWEARRVADDLGCETVSLNVEGWRGMTK